MTELLLLVLLVAGFLLHRSLTARIERLEATVRELEAERAPLPLPAAPVAPMPEPVLEQPRAAARVILPPRETVEEPAPPAEAEPIEVHDVSGDGHEEKAKLRRAQPEREDEPEPSPPPPSRTPAEIFEQLVGGKLPIWVGGAALAFAGFYLVKLAIEAGLLSPPVRIALAALAGLALIAAAELAGLWRRFVDDPRVAQALAGAGVATLYATAYLASAVYGLITPFAAFALMAGVTALALGLALRHGAPTAIMGLIGGFVTPLVAGAESESVIPLLIYLGLLSAGLFALAIRRGWLWLALLTAVGSFLWGVLLIAADAGDQGLAVGGFVLAFAFAAAAVSPASAPDQSPVQRILLRGIPIAVGLAELAALIPASGFGLEAWGLYLLLAGGAAWLAMREGRLTPILIGALLLSLAALAGGVAETPAGVLLFAAGGIVAVFGGAGHAFARRPGDGPIWAGIGAAALIVPFAILRGGREALFPEPGWAALAALLALAPLHLAWRARSEARGTAPFDLALQTGAGAAALLGMAALGDLLPWRIIPAGFVAVAILLAVAARRIGDGGLGRQSLAAAAIAGLTWVAQDYPVRDFGRLVSVMDAVKIGEAAQALLLPALALALLAWLHRGYARAVLGGLALLLATASVAAVVAAGWRPLVVAAAALATDEAVRRGLLARAVALLAAAGALLWVAASGAGLFPALGISLAGGHLLLPWLPEPIDAVRAMIAPAAIVVAAAWRGEAPLVRRLMLIGAGLGIAGGLYVLLKQPARIDDEADFVARGFVERALFTQLLFVAGFGFARFGWRTTALALSLTALARVIWYDLLVLNPFFVAQDVGAAPVANWLVAHFALAAGWTGLLWRDAAGRLRLALLGGLVVVLLGGLLLATRQAFQGALLVEGQVGRSEFYAYSVAALATALVILGWGWRARDGAMRIAGLSLLALVVVKVFLVDAAVLEGVLRALSFLGLGVALIGIGWAYGRLLRRDKQSPISVEDSPAL